MCCDRHGYYYVLTMQTLGSQLVEDPCAHVACSNTNRVGIFRKGFQKRTCLAVTSWQYLQNKFRASGSLTGIFRKCVFAF